MRIELRDHSKPCEHPSSTEDPQPGEAGFGSGFAIPRGAYEEYDGGDSTKAMPWLCGEVGCPGGALRVFEFNGTGRSLRTSERGSGEFAGRRWQRWIEWAPDDEGTTR